MPSPERSRRELRNRAKLALWLALPFIGLMLLVSPRGDFPLNDDWVYAKMVQALAERGHFGLSPFSNAYALTQTLYAAPLVKLFGFSFTLLRLTTIFMGWVTVCFTAFTARELGLPNRSAVLAALTVFVNPLFINLSYTFMTDVPFCAFASISTYYFVKSLKTPSPLNILLGTLFSIAAFYSRQFGALLPIAFVLAAILQWRACFRVTRWQYAAALVVPWLIMIAALPALAATRDFYLEPVDLGDLYSKQLAEKYLAMLLLSVSCIAPVAVFYFGLFLLPPASVKLAQAWNFTRSSLRYERLLTLFSILIVPVLLTWGLMVLEAWHDIPQILRIFGTPAIGPATFRILYPPPWVVEFPSLSDGLAVLRLVVGVTAALMGSSVIAFLVAHFLRLVKRHAYRIRLSQSIFLIILAAGFISLPPFVMGEQYFDRYFVPAAPPLILLLTSTFLARIRILDLCAATFFCAVLFVMSLIGIQDYMAWNTARWEAIAFLKSKYGASDNEINGGFEFNGMYTSDEFIKRKSKYPETEVGEWWSLPETKYILSPMSSKALYPNDYPELDRVPYFSWLGFRTRYMYILYMPDQ